MSTGNRRGPARSSEASPKDGGLQKHEEDTGTADRGPRITAAIIAALRTTPPTEEQDRELRKSLQRDRWWPHAPALRDEYGLILIGSRRTKMAEELGIEPNVKTEEFGKGEEADNRRIQVALASNAASAGTSKADRKALAISLYKASAGVWTQERIAKVVGVSQKQVSVYLTGINTSGINSPPREEKRGRKRGSLGKTKPKPKSIKASVTTLEAPVAVKASVEKIEAVDTPIEAPVPTNLTIDSALSNAAYGGVMPKAEFNTIRQCLRIDSIEKIVKRGAVDEETKDRYANALAILEKYETALVIRAAAKGGTPR